MFELINFLGQYICFFFLHVCGNGSFPKPLTSAEEREYLIKANDGDIEARNKLVEHNLRLVAHIIKKYYTSQSDQDDLVSIGTIGLIKAINTFDINKNIKLSSYASRCIENEILMHFRNIKKTAQDISLNEAIDTDKDGNALSLIDILSTDDNILESLNTKLNIGKIYEYINSELDEREKKVIFLRYGLNGEEPITQREVAKLLGVSRSYISRIETKALKTLRRKYEKSSNLK
ncbi:MAG: RNA polymerase sporulation sigma factor SigK [Ruminococcus sp.]|nr:RNA polymerase sporulation sigma factor SigK [Ruminococcus sp.]